MRRIYLVIIVLLATAGCGSRPHCLTIDAQGIADADHSKAQLRAMLENVIDHTVTATLVMKRDGPTSAQAISKAIAVAVDRHQADWDRNVVASWNTLAPSEIEQVCSAFTNKDQATYLRYATRVGREARSRNEPVLTQAAYEVVAAIF